MTTAHDILGPHGAFSNLIKGWESRPQQIKMAEAVEEALQYEDEQPLVVEAATGTGKSLAYLAPIVESGYQAIVSTANKTLQAQLIGKDLPLMRRAKLQRGGRPLTFAVAKGKGNYVCLLKVGKALPDLLITKWIHGSDTGDIDEAPFPFTVEDKRACCCDDTCLGIKCPLASQCFYLDAKAQRAAADIVVTNHALLILHAMMPHTGILPLHPVLVVDEAHQLESYTINAYSKRLSMASFRGPAREWAGAAGLVLGDMAQGRIDPEAYSDDALIPPGQEFGSALDLAHELKGAATDIAAHGYREIDMYGTDDEADAQSEADVRYLDNLSRVVYTLGYRTTDGAVRHITRDREGRLAAENTMIDVSSPLADMAAQFKTVIYTSATLATGRGDFSYFRRSCGVAEGAAELQLGSVFDYSRQAVIYLPNREVMPDPKRKRQFDAKVLVGLRRLVNATEGNALCLFTSWVALKSAAQYLDAETIWPVKQQGDMGKAALINWLKTTPNAVLCATASFWQGIDVPGDALKMVTIDKLPFASPSPVELARQAERGGKLRAFNSLTLPEMTLKLRQGFGRLIRRNTDYGIVAIFDPRLLTKGYGGRVLAALPDAPVVRKVKDVEAFLQCWASPAEMRAPLYRDTEATVENEMQWMGTKVPQGNINPN